MSNLIITIISIALVAVASIMGVYYGGTAFQNNLGQVYANMLINESQQVMSADTEYMLSKDETSFDDFLPDQPVQNQYTTGRVPILGLDTWGQGSGTSEQILWYTHFAHVTCVNNNAQSLNGNYIVGYRINLSLNGKNAISYMFNALSAQSPCTSLANGLDFSLITMANHPLIQMCKAINAKTSVPSGLTYSASGVPETTSIQTDTSRFAIWTNLDIFYPSDPTAVNYCMIAQTGQFGPGYDAMIYTFIQ